jgi:hypothetical protein
MPKAFLRVTLDAHNEKNAQTTLSRLRKTIGGEMASLEPYHKGGFTACLAIDLPAGTWPELVVAALSLAQDFGYGWEVTGGIDEEVELNASRFRLAGITSASLSLSK